MDAQLSKLESLNYDIRVAILEECHSFDDLAALIRASPTFLETFLDTKPRVLQYVTANILGPATRDAAILSQTSLFVGEDKERPSHVDEVIRDYKARSRVTGPPWVKSMDAEAAVALARVTRLTQFCVDIFGYFHCRYFEHKMDPTENGALLPHSPRLSRREYVRIAQAVLRVQILALISGGPFGEGGESAEFVTCLAPLFEVWEWQQISDMNGFLGKLLRAVSKFPGHHMSNVWDLWHELYSADLRAYVQRMGLVVGAYFRGILYGHISKEVIVMQILFQVTTRILTGAATTTTLP